MSSPCLNCGTAVANRYCPNCGQELDSNRGPIGQLVHEFADEVLSLEGRLFGSLRDLFFRPGVLTCRYLAGKRASQLPPLRLYLLASLVFFFLFSLTPPDVSNTNVYVGDQIIGREAPDPDAVGHVRLLRSDPDDWLSRYLEPRLEAQREKFRSVDPQRLIDDIYEAVAQMLPRTLILFLPVLALILKLLYIRSRRLYYDHFIFALHAQSFIFCFLSLSWFVPVPALLWLLLFLLVGPIYLLTALRRVYRQGWLRTVAKTGLLTIAYVVLLTLVSGLTTVYVLFTL